MSARAEIAFHKMEAIRLNALACARCGHRLSSHSIAVNLCSGVLGGKGCKCAGFAETGQTESLFDA